MEIVYRLSFIVYRLSFIVYRLSFIVSGLRILTIPKLRNDRMNFRDAEIEKLGPTHTDLNMSLKEWILKIPGGNRKS